MRRRGLSRKQVDELSDTIPRNDPFEKSGKPVYYGRNLEEVEEAHVPWLRQRRRANRGKKWPDDFRGFGSNVKPSRAP